MKQAPTEWPQREKYRYYAIRGGGEDVLTDENEAVTLNPGYWACSIILNKMQRTNTATIRITKPTRVRVEGKGVEYKIVQI